MKFINPPDSAAIAELMEIRARAMQDIHEATGVAEVQPSETSGVWERIADFQRKVGRAFLEAMERAYGRMG